MKRKPIIKRIPVRFDEPGLTYDMPGLHYDQEFIEIEIEPMSQIVLSLKTLTEADLIKDVRTYAASLTEHAADFTGITPSVADLLAAATTFEGLCTTADRLEREAIAATKAKNEGRAVLEGAITDAAGWSSTKIKNELTLSKVWTLKKQATPTTSIDQVTNFSASFGDEEGEVHLTWNFVEKAQAYEIEYKLPTGEWTHAKSVGKKTNVDLKDLPRGVDIQFRIRALGPKELEGPWSDIAQHMAR